MMYNTASPPLPHCSITAMRISSFIVTYFTFSKLTQPGPEIASLLALLREWKVPQLGVGSTIWHNRMARWQQDTGFSRNVKTAGLQDAQPLLFHVHPLSFDVTGFCKSYTFAKEEKTNI